MPTPLSAEQGRTEAGDDSHNWFLPPELGFECCRNCGIIRRLDHQHKPCPGKIGIALRGPLGEGTPS